MPNGSQIKHNSHGDYDMRGMCTHTHTHLHDETV